MTRFEKAW